MYKNILLLLIMVAVIVAVDLGLFRHQTGPRLLANVGIVLVFLAFYLIYVRNK